MPGAYVACYLAGFAAGCVATVVWILTGPLIARAWRERRRHSLYNHRGYRS